MSDQFLAEASVLIQANTVAFKKELAAALATVPKVIPIEIVATGGGGSAARTAAGELAAVQAAISSGGALLEKSAAEATAAVGTTTKALQQQTAAASTAGEALQRSSASSAAIAATNQRLATASASVAKAQETVSSTTGATISLQTRANRAALALAAADEAVAAAARGAAPLQERLALSVQAAAAALVKETEAALADAAALDAMSASAQHAAVAQRNVARGAATSALAAIGLRGATLTANAGFIAGAAAAITFAKSLQTFANSETTINTLGAVTGATAEQLQQASDAAKQLGADITLPSVSASSAADAITELSKAGLSLQDSIAGARGVLQLATAAAIDNEQAVQIAASALNAFGLAGDQAVHVADVLANAANLSQGSIADVGLSLQQTAAVARQTGLSFEDTAAILTLLARNGIRGSDAGTSLRVSLIKLINPTAKAAEVLKRLNVEVRDAAGNVRPEVFADFAAAQSRLTKAQQDANAAIVFGTDGIRTYAIAAREGVAGINDVRKELEKQGTAAEIAGARTQGTAGSFERLKNAASNLGLSIGESLATPTSDFVDILSGGIENIDAAVSKFNELTDASEQQAKAFGELAKQAGKINFAVAARGFTDTGAAGAKLAEVNREIAATGGHASAELLNEQQVLTALVSVLGKPVAGQGLLDEQTKLNKALVASQSEGVAATDVMEGYRDSLHNTALEAEGLRNRLDEAFDRAASAPPTPVAPTPQRPIPIGPTAKLGRRAALAQARGDLQALKKIQQIQLSNAREALANSRGNIKQRTKLFNQVTAAESALATTQTQITQKAATDREQKAREAEQKRKKADQDFLDALGLGRAPVERRVTKAEGTPGLADDIKRQEQLRARVLTEINRISARSFADAQDKAKQISDRNAELDTIDQKIIDLNKQRDENLAKIAEDKFQLRINAAQATGNIALIARTLDQRASELRKAIVAAKGNKELQDTLNDQLRDVNKSREQMISDAEEARIHLADIRGQLRGDDDAELPLINARIARLQKAIAAAKREHKATLALETALAETQLQRKEILDKATDDNKKQTTAFDLLKQAADTFNQNAGNLINPNQPFAGPTGFTADIAQFLIRRQKPAAGPTAAGPTAGPVPPVQLQDQPLIQAIEKLTDAIIGSTGNSSTATGTAAARQSRVWHSENLMARRFQEA